MSGDREPILPAVRAAVLFRAKGRCEDCGADTALELHHLTYRKFGGEIFGHEGAGRSARALPALPPRFAISDRSVNSMRIWRHRPH